MKKATTDLTEEIIAQEEALRTAMLVSDIQVLDSLIHDDLIFHIPSGHVASKQMDLEAYRTGIMKLEDLEYGERNIKLHDSGAVVSVAVNMRGSFGDQAIDGQFRFLRVWKKEVASWKIIAGSSVGI